MIDRFFSRVNLEVFIWPLGLIALAVMNPEVEHMSICLIKNLGFENCPGCGLGRSISYAFHGEFIKSFETHILGMAAIAMLMYRVVLLSIQSLKTSKS